MPDATRKIIDSIIGRSLISAETVSQELRSRLLKTLSQERRFFSQADLMITARRIIDEYEPILAQNLYDSEVASWVAGAANVASRLPPSIIDLGIGGGIVPPGDITATLWPDDEEPVLRFPALERAAQHLADKRVVTREQFDELTNQAKQQAFMVTGISSEGTLTKLRDTLAENLREGPSLKAFRKAVEESIETSPIGPGQLERVYRTEVQTAFSVGRNEIADNPIVEELFPYQEYLCIHDARCRPEHRELESLGLDGTNIYRRDDPMWRYFDPPWAWNCRCGTNLLTVEAAARKGVHEAQEWIRTGHPPLIPEWRIEAIPFRPDPKWVLRRSIAA